MQTPLTAQAAHTLNTTESHRSRDAAASFSSFSKPIIVDALLRFITFVSACAGGARVISGLKDSPFRVSQTTAKDQGTLMAATATAISGERVSAL